MATALIDYNIRVNGLYLVFVPCQHAVWSVTEQIRRKDALVKQTLAEKEDLVADLLAIPREHFEHIADMASETPTTPDGSKSSNLVDRLLASVFQVVKMHLLTIIDAKGVRV